MRLDRLTHSGAVPFFVRDEELYTVVITNHEGDWIFPKGVIDPGKSPQEIASIEAYEEAGLVGEVDPTPIGRYITPQWGMEYIVEMYLLKVEEILDDWEESSWRERRMLTMSEAKAIIWEGLRSIVESAERSLANQE